MTEKKKNYFETNFDKFMWLTSGIIIIIIVMIAITACDTATRYIISSEPVQNVLCEHGIKKGECKNDHGKGNDLIVVDTLIDTVIHSGTLVVIDTVFCEDGDCDD